MTRLSTAVLTVLFAAGLGLSAVAAPSNPGSHGNIGTNVIAQASPEASAMPEATAMPAATAMPEASAMPEATAMPAASSSSSMPAMNFGAPPSGQIPILFNDHHVYSKPDKLKQGRVLAALVRGNTILIPLRSMFEQMGATVSYNAGSKTVDVSKPGSDVKVTVGKPEVIINGESRPLDVPPEIYQGHVVV
nr:copper amine oxidase N-terminal domain-containing protein [Candidatus Eremiobacteraeota bacterium]